MTTKIFETESNDVKTSSENGSPYMVYRRQKKNASAIKTARK
jgi:hypothetical protein